MAIRMAGLASGLDTNTMVDKIMEAEKKPVRLKEAEIRNVEAKKAEWKEVEGFVRNVKQTNSQLQNKRLFTNKITEVSNPAVVGVEIGDSVKNGTYTIEDVKLAKPGQISSFESIPIQSQKPNRIIGDKIWSSDSNEKFLDKYLHMFINTKFEDVGLKINDQDVYVNAKDTVRTLINKINDASDDVKATYDTDKQKIIIEGKDGATVKLEAGNDRFLDKLGLEDFNGKIMKNSEIANFRSVMQEVDYLEDVDKGFFTINGYTFTVDPERESVEDIIGKINQSKAGVRANYDEISNKFNLVSQNPGEDLVLENDTSGLLHTLKVMNDDRDIYKGQNASFKLDGIKYERPGNEVIIDNMKIFLNKETEEGEKISVNVMHDTETVIARIAEFVQSYNDAVTTIENKVAKDAPLQGDSTANTLINNLRQKISGSVNGVEQKFSQLAMIGISTSGKSARLDIDEQELRSALLENPEEVSKLFTQDKNMYKPVELGKGNNNNNKFRSFKFPNIDIDELKITVGDKVYQTGGTDYKILRKSELHTLKASKLDIIKYTINGDIQNKRDYMVKLGKAIPENYVIIDDVTKELEFGETPDSGVAVIVESQKSRDMSEFGNEDGIANRVEKFLDPYVGYGGALIEKSRLFDRRINDMNDWIQKTNDRLSIREDNLKNQFAAMEGALQSSKSQSAWLSNFKM